MAVNADMNQISLEYYSLTSKGPDRLENEDSYHVMETEEQYLFCLADGIGGLSQGAFASKIAIEPFTNTIITDQDLSSLINKANRGMMQEGIKRNQTMGSTLTTALVHKKTGKITIASIGDSRAYLFHETIWKTSDDTLVQELVDMKILSETQAFHHPMKHRLNNALGVHQEINCEILSLIHI